MLRAIVRSLPLSDKVSVAVINYQNTHYAAVRDRTRPYAAIHMRRTRVVSARGCVFGCFGKTCAVSVGLVPVRGVRLRLF